jgi:Spy/CpxP family protein refolding chaperone
MDIIIFFHFGTIAAVNSFAPALRKRKDGSMRKFRLITMFGLLVLLATLLNLMAGSPSRTDKPHSDWILRGSIVSTLDLTVEQRRQIRRMYISFQNEVAPILSQRVEKETALRLLWKQNRPDQQKINSFQMELQGLKWRLAEKYADYHLAIGNILTPEQLYRYGTILTTGKIVVLNRRGT